VLARQAAIGLVAATSEALPLNDAGSLRVLRIDLRVREA
jgi:hypothetical protein